MQHPFAGCESINAGYHKAGMLWPVYGDVVLPFRLFVCMRVMFRRVKALENIAAQVMVATGP